MRYICSVIQRGNATNVRNIFNTSIMKTVVIKEVELPLLPPKGWKKKVAEAAGCCEKTVYNALRGNLKGPQANKVLEVYKQLFGKVISSETVNR